MCLKLPVLLVLMCISLMAVGGGVSLYCKVSDDIPERCTVGQYYLQCSMMDLGTAYWGKMHLRNSSETSTQDFTQLDELLKEKSSVSFSDIYDRLKEGDIDGACRVIGQALADSFVYELRTSRVLALQIIAVIVLGSTFAQLSGSMGTYVHENGFMVTYMVLIALLLGDFVVVQDVVTTTIGDVTDFMRAFYPMYASSILYVSGPESARCSQAILILIIYVCQNGIIRFILPFIKCSGLIALVNNLNKEDNFSRLAGLMKKLAGWGLGCMFAVVTGISIVKNMLAPSIDRVSRNGILKAIGRMSGMSSVSAVLSVMISTGEFIKNCMGVACTVAIVILAAFPMVKILVIVLTLRCIAALVQPVGDSRYAEGVSIMASTAELMLRACGISVMMFVISIALMTMSIGGQ